MLSLTSGMKYMYCEGTVSFRYKWDGLESYINTCAGPTRRLYNA